MADTKSVGGDILYYAREYLDAYKQYIYADKELDENRTYKKFLLVRQEGNRQVKRNIGHYNLDMIIALGYPATVEVIYRKREMELLESDFDKEIKKLKDNNPN